MHILWQVFSQAGDHYAHEAFLDEPRRALTDVLSHVACIAQLNNCRGGVCVCVRVCVCLTMTLCGGVGWV